MKKLIAIGALALALNPFSSPAEGDPGTSAVVHQQVIKEPVNLRPNHVSVAIRNHRIKQKQERLLAANTEKVQTVVSQLKGHVNKTWYVFSGATPRGWDCSGLVMWTYEQLGFNLEHRASKQADAGTKVKDPKVGDIVAFTYKGSKSAYHVGIYIGSGKMVHAPKHGHLTRVESVSKFAGEYSKVTYSRLIETT